MFLKGKRNSCYFIERPQRKFKKKTRNSWPAFFPAHRSLNLGFVLCRHQGKMGCQLYTQIGRSTPRKFSYQNTEGAAMRALTPDHCLPLLQSTFSGICRSHGPPGLSPVSAPTLFRLQGKAGYEHTAAAISYKVFSPHLRCELGLTRGLVKHSAKENCQ